MGRDEDIAWGLLIKRYSSLGMWELEGEFDRNI